MPPRTLRGLIGRGWYEAPGRKPGAWPGTLCAGRGWFSGLPCGVVNDSAPSELGSFILIPDRVAPERQDVAELVGGHLGEPALAGADDVLRQRGLLLDHLVDALLQRAADD